MCKYLVAENIRKNIAYNFNGLLEEMQTTYARETISNCIGNTDEITENILPRNGNRRQRMSDFLKFILKEDHNVIEFEKNVKTKRFGKTARNEGKRSRTDFVYARYR